jgi:hypothetical protein
MSEEDDSYESEENKPPIINDEDDTPSDVDDENAAEKTEGSSEYAQSEIVGVRDATTGDAGVDDDENASPVAPAFEGFQVSLKFGPARTLGGLIPSMESILLGIPNQLIGKFVQGLPAELQALLPAGALEGIVGAVVNTAISGGTVSLNNLLKSVAGVALGSAINQALRSVQTNINIPIVSELAGSIGAIALNRIAQEIPLNITGTNTSLNTTTGAVLASVIGTVTTNAISRATQGIPVDINVIGTEVNLALQNSGIQVNISGVTNNIVATILSSTIGNAINGIVPILSSNLSLSVAGSLSGIGLNISANFAQTLIPSIQLQAVLPANLQNAIPRIPTRLSADYVPNRVAVNRKTAEEIAPNDERVPLEENESKLPPLDGKRLRGDLPISANFTVASVTSNSRVYKVPYYRGTTELSVQEIYENLKFLAENVLERVRAEFPRMWINSALRNPKNDKDKSYHTKGLAVDLQWDSNNFNAMAARANWMYSNIPSLKELLLETKGPSHRGGKFWIHVAVEQGYSGTPKASTWLLGSNKKIPYNNGFVKG